MVYDTYYTTVNGVYKPIYNKGGPTLYHVPLLFESVHELLVPQMKLAMHQSTVVLGFFNPFCRSNSHMVYFKEG